MRELKFRVWSEEDKQYRSDIRVSDLVIDIDGAPSTIYSAEGDRFDIEQYTGLKDKSGEEIYEGDIVRVSYGYNYEVRQFRTGAWRIGRDDLYTWADSSEVIGNIHESPELLEEEGC